MRTFCNRGCCCLVSREFKGGVKFYPRPKREKAGICIYDPEKDKILLVQSRGMKWGAPKGALEESDCSILDCALRETREETG